MKKEQEEKLEKTINDLSGFLERDFSSRFKDLNPKEDRQLFFLAGILAKLKILLKDSKENKENIISFRPLQRIK